ncbi:MAG: hypothetical protein A2020_15160 [Lentisphaerae bacterium GWF2_45_14]|nr:MAG: hypothetical protein A2020_15160 [Lentisphaerae bacterium GWF2_45_14]
MRRVQILIIGILVLSISSSFAKTPVAMSSLSAPESLAPEKQLIEEIMQAELSSSDNITLVDRESLQRALKEMQMSEQGMLDPATASKLGKIVGAKFFCTGKITESGSKKMVIVKIIDVETTVAKLSYAVLTDKDDAVQTGKTLAQNIEKLIAQHEKDNASRVADSKANSAKPVPADWKRPVVMVVIPEMHVAHQVIDPAAETEIVKRLIGEKFKVIDSEYIRVLKTNPEQAKVIFGVLSTSSDYAKQKGADVLIYGEAISEQGASIGEFEGCRARVELKAIDTKNGEILLSDSAYAGATDLAETVAGKKAIQNAADKLAGPFIYSLAEKWNSNAK